jgi:hypothetical protein
LRADSDRSAERWDPGAVDRHEVTLMTVDHPHVRILSLDPDVLTAAGIDLRMVTYTAESGSEDAERLVLNPAKGEAFGRATRTAGRRVVINGFCILRDLDG